MKAVIGLGNPGSRYTGTRHNVGFEVIDELARGFGSPAYRQRFQAQLAEAAELGEKVLLVKPDTFMNLSGQSVRQIMDFYQLEPAQMLVVCDDIALPLGKLRVRSQGTHGGHNGLRNIQEHLGTTAYPRLRIGVDSPRDDAVDHVLGRFRAGELAVIRDAVQKAADAALVCIREGITVCMNKFNGDPEGKPKKPPRGKPADE